MTSFQEANQARLKLKMALSRHAFYSSSWVEMEDGDWNVVVNVSATKIGDRIRGLVPTVFEGVSIRTTNSGK